MIAALFMRMSTFSTLALMFAAVARTEAWLLRSSGISLVVTSGLEDLMASMSGWILWRERPARMIRAGDPSAKDNAVSTPIPPVLGPVMRTAFFVSKY